MMQPLIVHFLCLTVLGCAWMPASGRGAAVTIVPTEQGLAVNAGGTLDFQVGYPMLLGKDPSRPLHPLIEVAPGKDTAALKYEGGAGAGLTIHPDCTVDIVFSAVPRDVKNYGCTTFLSIRFIDGGVWRMNDGKGKPFPAEKSTPPQFYHGHPETFSIFGGGGQGLTFTMTRTPYVELTDNREWQQNIFVWRFFSPLDPGHLSDRIKIVPVELPAGGGAPSS